MIRYSIVLVILTLLPTSRAPAQRLNNPTPPGVTPRVWKFFKNLPQGALEERIAYLSKDISDGLTENQKRTIAVVEFADLRGNVTDFGRFIAEELITRLHQTKKFKVIERQLLNKVVAEQKLSLAGMIDQTSAQKLGRLLGVDAIASGTVTDLGKSLRVNARLIDASTGEIFAVASAEITKDEAVMKLLGASETGPISKQADEPSAVQRIDDLGFTFELQPCRVSTSLVTCEMSIKNNGDDRGFSLEVDGSRLFDELGNSYSAINVRLGNQNGAAPHIDFVSDITTKARITFQPLPPQATKITMLQIHFGSFSDGRTIKFRNVPLVKAGTREGGS
jgi:TolB-like protein